jgi:hypothetical protein
MSVFDFIAQDSLPETETQRQPSEESAQSFQSEQSAQSFQSERRRSSASFAPEAEWIFYEDQEMSAKELTQESKPIRVDGKSPVMSCYSKPIIVDKEPLIDTCML